MPKTGGGCINNIAVAQAVQAAVKPKFYGHSVLKSKVVTNWPENLAREYERITNTYMTVLNKALAEHLPEIHRAIDAERENMRHDSDESILSIIVKVFLQIWQEFEKSSESFGLEKRLTKLANLTRKLTIREWKRVVHKTLGINILEDYYMGEFFAGMLKEWTTLNVNLIKTIPKNTLSEMMDIVREGYTLGKSNTAIGKDIQKVYHINRGHAQFIARDQMAKLNADITHAQQNDAGVEEYVWSTSDDQRVRHRHREFNGKRFKWSNPPVVDVKTGRKAHPAQDYNCRCVALPVFNLQGLNLPWEGK